MQAVLCVGFGDCQVTRDGKVIYTEQQIRDENYPTAQTYEDMAKDDPDHDWKIWFYGPMHEETYQRHGPGMWVIVDSGPGFA